MTLVNKRTETEEEFDRTKLEESITRAGATEERAKEIASGIDSTTLETTEEIRRLVAEELRKTDAAIAERYEGTRNLAAKKHGDHESIGRKHRRFDHHRAPRKYTYLESRNCSCRNKGDAPARNGPRKAGCN
jgi:hypothetical protein